MGAVGRRGGRGYACRPDSGRARLPPVAGRRAFTADLSDAPTPTSPRAAGSRHRAGPGAARRARARPHAQGQRRQGGQLPPDQLGRTGAQGLGPDEGPEGPQHRGPVRRRPARHADAQEAARGVGQRTCQPGARRPGGAHPGLRGAAGGRQRRHQGVPAGALLRRLHPLAAAAGQPDHPRAAGQRGQGHPLDGPGVDQRHAGAREDRLVHGRGRLPHARRARRALRRTREVKPSSDLTRVTFAVLTLALLIGASLWVMQPFLGPTIWATMVVVATWPLMLRVQGALRGRRWAAVTVMTLLLLLLFVVPLVVAIVTIVQHADEIVAWGKLITSYRPSRTPPDWLLALPMGSRLGVLWEQAVAAGLSGVMERLAPYAGNVTKWFVAEVGSVGFLLLQFLMTVVIAGILYASGEEAADQVRRFAHRLAGERGASTVKLAGDAIRGVALGVGVTAVVQSVLGGVALAIVDVPFAGLLSAVMFMLCIAQVGPAPVLVPAVVWVFWGGQVGWGIFLTVCTVVITLLDNVLRPALIRMGADLPLLLIFAGVIGGLLAFGLVGIFVGPVVLAVGYMLLEAWMDEVPPPS
ncbi:MAG: AI-2E family transporter YdiK [Rubrivivax sp.]|nr:AI-2E family transporter YdiK [Rubrivivax sp.]